MAAARPVVNIQSADKDGSAGSTRLPGVFVAPIRNDVVHFVHSQMAKNSRQAYSVSKKAGHQTSAESWGTGRAVSRIPRVSGGGTHRSGQAAFGNMCRGGRMFAPTKVYRKWHRMVNVNQKRFAVASALAASAVPALVMARGHRINEIPEVPLVVDNAVESYQKTAKAVAMLKRVGAGAELDKAAASKKLRRGKGKMRNRRHTMRRGPLVVYNNDNGVVKAFRNIPGVELANVNRLNLLQLAPGGHLGRFCIWTQGAFEALDKLYGSLRKASAAKKGYHLPRPKMTNADLARLINSDEIQKVVRAAKPTARRTVHRKNPLKNLGAAQKLNPNAAATKRAAILTERKNAEAKKNKKVSAEDRKTRHARDAAKKAFGAKLNAKLNC